jgi:protein transport protein SEC23
MNRIDATRMVIPLGCLFAPLSVPAVELPYDPVVCACGGVLNPECQVDYRSKAWLCPFCNSRNNFPPHYASMSESHLPAELMKQYSVVEYVKQMQRPPTTFVFVVDTCVDTESEVESLRDNVVRTISQLPEHVNVALITFGATVQLHDLSGNSDAPRSLVFRGSVELTGEMMKRFVKRPERYVLPLADAEFAITSLVEELAVDCWPVAKEHRPLRCTGAAISAAASLLEVVSPKAGSAVLAFLSGACTEGPGIVVPCPRETMIRTHTDIRDKRAPYYEPAAAFYDTLMRRMVVQGHALHVVSACLDQVGLSEMRGCIQATGGVLITTDLWKRGQLKSSIERFFERHSNGQLAMGMNATIDVHTSPTWKVMGMIGQCTGTGKRSASVAESEMGLGGTSQWTTCYIDSRSTFAAYFEPAVPPPQLAPADKTSRFVQFVTKYQQGSTDRIRVVTLRHYASASTNFAELGNSFDQAAAAVLLARVAVYKAEQGAQHFDVLRWIDRHVIRLVSRFGDYVKDQPQSLKLAAHFSNFPLFMFHLRRSAYIHVFNNSPDETATLRILLLKSNANDSIIMIHPTLHSYTMTDAVRPVPLDSSSLTPDNALLLDTFFEVLIHHGETIKAWRLAGYEENPDYAHFKAFLDAPRADARAVAATRFPAPRLIECGAGDGDARILYNRINPSRTHNNSAPGAVQDSYGKHDGELVYTDDASLQTFTAHLKTLAVQSAA